MIMNDLNLSANIIRNGGLVSRLNEYFRAVPQNVKDDNYWFYTISNLAYTLITFLHIFWVVVFYFMEQETLRNVQFASISVYVLAIALNRRGYHVLAMFLGLMEVNLHQGVAVTLLGWGAGFQNFIPLIALLPFLKYNENWFVKISLAASCMVTYLAIDFYMKNHIPIYIISKAASNFLIFSNALVAFLLVALWGIVLAISYQRTVTALMKKEQELFASKKAVEQAEILRQLEKKEQDSEIFQLRYVELKNSNDEIVLQKELIEALVAEQEIIIRQRTSELAETNFKLVNANKKLVELIQYNAHNLREPLARIMGAMYVMDYVSQEEFYGEIWPQMGKAVDDLDRSIKEVITIADETIVLYS